MLADLPVESFLGGSCLFLKQRQWPELGQQKLLRAEASSYITFSPRSSTSKKGQADTTTSHQKPPPCPLGNTGSQAMKKIGFYLSNP